ncbi:MAG: hypothetical protein C0595_02915 [Marinilabiliales bacterium]|nr:MAG: hypothetical protein C0595_02915 [Marinilabiliales bacterium]
MKSISLQLMQRKTIISVLIDLIAIGFIYYVPTISHLISLPLYLMEPMRLMLIIALVHSSKANAYLLALSLPIFSFVISGHPVFPKMLLITFELVFNVVLFYGLTKKIKYLFPSILLSIILSKVAYYIIKFGLIKLTILDSTLFSTPLYIQIVTALVFSSYVYIFYKKNKI